MNSTLDTIQIGGLSELQVENLKTDLKDAQAAALAEADAKHKAAGGLDFDALEMSLNAAEDRAQSVEHIAFADKDGHVADNLPPEAGPQLGPFELLQIQIWQTLSFAASNLVLLQRHLGNKELEAQAYSILDAAHECLQLAAKQVSEKANPPPPFATPEVKH